MSISHQAQFLKRKQDLIKELETFRQDLKLFEMPRPPSHDNAATSINKKDHFESNATSKESLLKENDRLRAENQRLLLKSAQCDELEANVSLLEKELQLSRSKTLGMTERIAKQLETIESLEMTVESLKEDLLATQRALRACRSDVRAAEEISGGKKMDNAERLAMTTQQQALILEVEKLKSIQIRYKDLINSVEEALSQKKVCLVSGLGRSEPTTILELANVLVSQKATK
jgi:hypothetical protein